MSMETRTGDKHLIEDETDEFLWGRVAFLIEQVIGVDLSHTLKLGPQHLTQFEAHLLHKLALLERLNHVMAQIASLSASSSRRERLNYALGYYRERDRQAPEVNPLVEHTDEEIMSEVQKRGLV